MSGKTVFATVVSIIAYIMVAVGVIRAYVVLSDIPLFKETAKEILIGGIILEFVFVVISRTAIRAAETAEINSTNLWRLNSDINKLSSKVSELNNTDEAGAQNESSFRRPSGAARSGFGNLIANSQNVGGSGIWYCRSCGEQNPSSSARCQSCGEDR